MGKTGFVRGNQGEERNFHLADKWPEAGSFS